MAYPRFQRARAHRFIRRTSGDFTVNGTNWANLDTGLDQTLEAQVGDVLEAEVVGLWGTEAVNGLLDVVTVVAGSPVNGFANAGAVTAAPPKYGIPGWRGTSGVETVASGAAHYTVVSGDLASGQVLLRLRVATQTATNKTLYAGTNHFFEFAVWNLGPQDPE